MSEALLLTLETPAGPADQQYSDPVQGRYEINLWYARDDRPGMLDISCFDPAGPNQHRIHWFEAQSIAILDEAGMRPALQAVGITVERIPRSKDSPERIRVTVPSIPTFCELANLFMASQTPEGETPFRFEPFESNETDSASFSARQMIEALGNGVALFGIDRTGPNGSHGNLSQHDVLTHCAWLALPRPVLNRLIAHAKALCLAAEAAGIPADQATPDMKNFAEMLDTTIHSSSLAHSITKTGFGSSRLSPIVGNLWEKIPEYIRLIGTKQLARLGSVAVAAT